METIICISMFLQKKLAMKLQLLKEGVIGLDGNVRSAKISYCTVWPGGRGVVEIYVQRTILLAAVKDTSVERECSDSQLRSTLHPTEQNKTQKALATLNPLNALERNLNAT